MARLSAGAGAFAVCLFISRLGAVPVPDEPRAPGFASAQISNPSTPPQAILDVLVLDRRGQPVVGLRPEDFSVAVDGKPRKVVSSRYVFRGPGSAAAAARHGVTPGGGAAGAEPSRTVLIAIDEASLIRGEERQVTGLATRLLDRLGPADAVAVVPVPSRQSRIALTADREAARENLRRIAGRAESLTAAANAGRSPAQLSLDLARADETEAQSGEQGLSAAEAASAITGATEIDLAGAGSGREAQIRASDTLDTLSQLLTGLRQLAGPKTVVLISSGFGTDEEPPILAEVSAAAARARATVSVLFRPEADWRRSVSGADAQVADPDHPGQGPVLLSSRPGSDQAYLVSLAAGTGGTFQTVGRNLDQVVERLAVELGGAYSLTIDSSESDRDASTHDLRTSVRRQGVRTVVARRRWAPCDEIAAMDVGVASPPAAPAQPARRASPPENPPAPVAAEPPRGAAAAAEADPETAVIMARVAEYLATYERDLAVVVAEETYRQSASGGAVSPSKADRVVLRSDFLMVKPPGEDEWLPFRDVFEVNGVAVREREDRLRKLFIEKPDTALVDGRRIMDESARYNVGNVERNINVPTLPLLFLQPWNLVRSSFKKHGEDAVEGLRAWRIDYVEQARPTLIKTQYGNDVFVSGSFWVDPVNGRILRTLLKADTGNVAVEVTVVYRKSEALGLWVPMEMKERYTQVDGTIAGSATYSNFRRFRVFTDQQIKIPKSP